MLKKIFIMLLAVAAASPVYAELEVKHEKKIVGDPTRAEKINALIAQDKPVMDEFLRRSKQVDKEYQARIEKIGKAQQQLKGKDKTGEAERMAKEIAELREEKKRELKKIEKEIKTFREKYNHPPFVEKKV